MSPPPEHDDSTLFDWLALERIPRVGPLTMARLCKAFGGPRAAMQADAKEIRRRTGLGEEISRAVAGLVPSRDAILRDMETLKRLGVRVMTRWDADYPSNLKEIYDPPALLFMRGDIRAEDEQAAAVVGTRNPTRYGIEMTEAITRDLVRAGVTVVSGLARGIDTACHKTAIREQGRTIGVLGCGIDVPYPKENGALMEEMVHSGAVISEFRPGVPPLATNFYRRNRIISGLSKGILVIQATRNSGSLITTSHALDQNRDVFAVPGNVTNPRSQGCHHLLKQGAGLVESGEDIISALFSTSGVTRQENLFPSAEHEEALPETARTVLEALDPDPVPIDLLCESLKMDASKIAAVLMELEISGLVRQHPGKMFSRIMR